MSIAQMISLLVLGLFAGILAGSAKFTLALPAVVVNRAFGVFLLIVALRYLIAR